MKTAAIQEPNLLLCFCAFGWWSILFAPAQRCEVVSHVLHFACTERLTNVVKKRLAFLFLCHSGKTLSTWQFFSCQDGCMARTIPVAVQILHNAHRKGLSPRRFVHSSFYPLSFSLTPFSLSFSSLSLHFLSLSLSHTHTHTHSLSLSLSLSLRSNGWKAVFHCKVGKYFTKLPGTWSLFFLSFHDLTFLSTNRIFSRKKGDKSRTGKEEKEHCRRHW